MNWKRVLLPFLYDLSIESLTESADAGNRPAIDPLEIDTIVVPAHEEGFRDVFLGENMWRAIRMHSSMIPRIRFIAGYQVAPESAITHIAEVSKIEPWKDTQKYALYFKEPAKKIERIPLVPGGRVKPPYSSRYTSIARIKNAKTLDDVFWHHGQPLKRIKSRTVQKRDAPRYTRALSMLSSLAAFAVSVLRHLSKYVAEASEQAANAGNVRDVSNIMEKLWPEQAKAESKKLESESD